jgi:hypothetical protein
MSDEFYDTVQVEKQHEPDWPWLWILPSSPVRAAADPSPPPLPRPPLEDARPDVADDACGFYGWVGTDVENEPDGPWPEVFLPPTDSCAAAPPSPSPPPSPDPFVPVGGYGDAFGDPDEQYDMALNALGAEYHRRAAQERALRPHAPRRWVHDYSSPDGWVALSPDSFQGSTGGDDPGPPNTPPEDEEGHLAEFRSRHGDANSLAGDCTTPTQLSPQGSWVEP